MDAYTILGVARTASQAAIKAAWRAKAKTCHPDCSPTPNQSMSAINAAYDSLKDPARRKAYDAQQCLAGDFIGNANDLFRGLDDLFADIFGQPAPARGKDRHIEITMPFDAPLRDQQIRIEDGPDAQWLAHIPAGVAHGQTVRLRGQGHAGPDGAGDALVRISCAPHPLFVREGTTLMCPQLHIALPTAALGGVVSIPGIGGETVDLHVHEGAQTGDKIEVPGLGFPPLGGGQRGAFQARLVVATPTDLTPEECACLRAMATRLHAPIRAAA